MRQDDRAMVTPGPRAAFLIALAISVVACVPTPGGGASAGSDDAGAGVPSATASATGPTPVPTFVRPTPTPTPPFRTYLVQRGDTLSKIARMFRTSTRSLSYWNRVRYPTLDPDSPAYAPDRIELGWILQFHPDDEVDPEDLPTLSPVPTPSAGPSVSTSPLASPSTPAFDGSVGASGTAARHG